MKIRSAASSDDHETSRKVPRIGWLVGATAMGALFGRFIILGAVRPEDRELWANLGSLVIASIAALCAIGIEAAIYRFRFTISQLLELLIVGAILMWLWQMYNAQAAANQILLDQQRDFMRDFIL